MLMAAEAASRAAGTDDLETFRRRSAEAERALLLAREELKLESNLADQARRHSIELRRSHADELLRHAKELSAGAEAIAERDAELELAREEARLAREGASCGGDASSSRASPEDLRQMEVLKHQLSVAEGELLRSREDVELEREAWRQTELQEMRQSLLGPEEERWQIQLQDMQEELAAAKIAEEEAEFLKGAVEAAENRLKTQAASHEERLRQLDDFHLEALARRDEELNLARLEVQCTQEEVGKHVTEALTGWKQRLAQREEELKTARDELSAEREHADHMKSDLERAAGSNQTYYVDELRRRDNVHAEAMGQREAELQRALRQVAEEKEEGERQRVEAEGWRHMLMKISGDMNATTDNLASEREKTAKAAIDLERAKGELRQVHQEEVNRLKEAHKEELARRDAEAGRVWQDVNSARQEVDRQRAEAERVIADVRAAHKDELARAEWMQTEALAKKDSENDKLKQEIQLVRDEASFQRAQAEEFWQQRCQEAEASVKGLRDEISRLRERHTNEVSAISADHARTVSMRDQEIERLRKDVQQERSAAERRRAEAEGQYQQRIAEAEALVKTTRAEAQQERERMLKAQQELERSMAELREVHAAELTKALTKQGNELAKRDEELEEVRQELKREREEGERMCSAVDDAWRGRLADMEKDLALVRSELEDARRGRDLAEQQNRQQEETWQQKSTELEVNLRAAQELATQQQERVERTQRESRRTLEQLEEKHSEEIVQRTVEHSRALAARDSEAEAAKRQAQSDREEAAQQTQEAQEAWRWLSRIEGDLKTAHADLKKERDQAAMMQVTSEQGMAELRVSHAEQMAKTKLEFSEAEDTWSARVARVKRELQTARHEVELERSSLSTVRAVSDRALAEAREASNEELSRMASRQAELLEARSAELDKARDAARAAQEEAGRRAFDTEEVWQRRVAEAEARGAAGVDLATKAQVDGQRAKAALEVCRQELEEERRLTEELRGRERASAEGLRQACAVAAQAEMVAEACKTEEMRMQAASSHGGSLRNSPVRGEDRSGNSSLRCSPAREDAYARGGYPQVSPYR